MRPSHPERRTPTFRQFAMVMAAVTWFAVLLPMGARAAGQLVTLADPVTPQKARVVAPGALRVAEYNDPARLPFSELDGGLLIDGQPHREGVLTTVPAGERLVIETVSALADLPTGQRPQLVQIVSPGTDFFMPLTFSGSSHNRDDFQGLFSVRLYADPETNVTWKFDRTSISGDASVVFAISGHYVKL